MTTIRFLKAVLLIAALFVWPEPEKRCAMPNFSSLTGAMSEPSTIRHVPASEADKPDLSFAVISDIHIQAWHKPSHRKLLAALNDLHTINPHADALVVNGDLTNGQPEDYAKLTELMTATPHPWRPFYTIGNHEFYKAWFGSSGKFDKDGFPHGESEGDSISRFLKLTGEKFVYYEKTVNGYPFLFLGSEQYRQSDASNGEDAFLSQRQLDWLWSSLRKHAADKRIFVFLHQPLPHTVSGTDECCANTRAVVQHEQLERALADYAQAVLFSGHTHRELKLPKTFVQGKFAMIGSSSVADPLSATDQALEQGASEGLYVEAYGKRVVVRGRDFKNGGWIREASFELD
ncbi:metallophosphoesterase family protein [Paenibacillus sp. MBLB4367]|uniref:metallophosphoesterase family protein n=1 Tax=Paenibacillus sp. MBLB4367 TaxID=3384767 RepID=UPI00390831BD